MSAKFILFLIVGRVLIWIAQKFAKDNEIKIQFINKLLSCSLCAGVWIYTILSAIFHFNALIDFPYIPAVTELVVGCFSSALMFFVEQGWRSWNEPIVIE